MASIVPGFISRYTEFLSAKRIPQELYTTYNVKRGLRNADGTGVLVGLTEIGGVHGYIIDEGEKTPVRGVLQYRGIDVKDLVSGFQTDGRFGFEETAFLLLFGYLPSSSELEDFTAYLSRTRVLPEGFTEDVILRAPSNSVMNTLARAVLANYSYDDNADDISVSNVLSQSMALIARFPVIVAYALQAKRRYYEKKSLFLHECDPKLTTAENFLRLIRSDKQYTRIEAEILDLALVIHAEHGGGNNSAFTTHVVTSSGTDTYSAIAAAVGALKGPLHGGASNRVRAMMVNIMENVKDWKDETEVSEYLGRILNKETFDRKGLIYGLGHAVYTLSDPRAELLKERAKFLADATGRTDEYDLYSLVERISPEAFLRLTGKSKEISANVDFYSGFVYTCLNIPEDLFTAIFAISRITGWCAHRVEEILSGGRIIRPAYKNVTKRQSYTLLNSR